jgi:hypothetical protein
VAEAAVAELSGEPSELAAESKEALAIIEPPVESSEPDAEVAEKKPTRRRRKRRRKPRVLAGDDPDQSQAVEPEVDHPDEVSVAAAEEPPEAEPASEEVEEEGRSKRRRKRRPSRKKRAGAVVEEAAPERGSGETEAKASREQETTAGDTREDAPAEAGDEKAPQGRKGPKGLHRTIPTWEEAIRLLVSANLEARSRRPATGSRSRAGTGGSKEGRGSSGRRAGGRRAGSGKKTAKKKS